MGTLVLLNDVSTEINEAGFLVGDSNPAISVLGKQQAETISSFLLDKVDIDVVARSDSSILHVLVHKIRLKSKGQHLTKADPKKLQGLRERNFGVLNNTQYPLTSAVFQHSRILPEKGESVMQCRSRLMVCLNGICNKNMGRTVLVVSHPFACQIITNVILQKGHTILTDFWQQKGSFIVFQFELGQFGIKWSFQSAYNSFVDQPYTQDQIYSKLLGKEGALSS